MGFMHFDRCLVLSRNQGNFQVPLEMVPLSHRLPINFQLFMGVVVWEWYRKLPKKGVPFLGVPGNSLNNGYTYLFCFWKAVENLGF